MTRDGNADKRAIREVIDTWLRATAEGDLDALGPLMAEDVVFLTPGSHEPMRGRDTFMSGFRSGLGQMRIDATSDIREIEVTGDWAYCWNYLKVTMSPRDGGEPQRRSGPVLSVFRRETDGRWVLFRDANMLSAT
jgi:uncharacterized protein (TIGR02246 family)